MTTVPVPWTWDTMLAAFKRQERAEALLAAQPERHSAELLSTWPSVVQVEAPPRWLARARYRPGPLGEDAWTWLWRTRFLSSPPYRRWAELAGVDLIRTEELMGRLIALRLVYPDGSLQQLAKGWVTGLVVSSIPRPAARSMGRSG